MLSDLLQNNGGEALNLQILLINLLVGLVMSLILRYHFQKFGSTLSNREEFAQVFPFVLLTTILIITVVKSSLALSLGLVGALSIVRFRTPIKEPEELAYLFISIAIGLGLGANQTLATVAASIFILLVMGFIGTIRRNSTEKSIYLSVDWEIEDDKVTGRYIERMSEILMQCGSGVDLRRFDIRGNSLEAVFFINVDDVVSLSLLTDKLRSNFPSIGVTFLDQNKLPGN